MKKKSTLIIVIFIITALVLIINLKYMNQNNILTKKDLKTNIQHSQAEPYFYTVYSSNYYTSSNYSIFGGLADLKTEVPGFMSISKSFHGIEGLIYIEYEFDTRNIYTDIMDTFIIDLLANGGMNLTGTTNLTLYVYNYTTDNYILIYKINGDTENIFRKNGYIEVELSKIFGINNIKYNLISQYKMKFKIVLHNKLVNTIPQDFEQKLYIYYIQLLIGKDIEIRNLEASRLVDLTNGYFHVIGNLTNMFELDNKTIQFGISNVFQYQTVIANFYIEYDLGYFVKEEILGILFHHLDWIYSSGASFYCEDPYISIFNFNTNSTISIQSIKEDPQSSLENVDPIRWDSRISVNKTGVINGSVIRVYYHAKITNLDPAPAYFSITIDLGTIQFVRSLSPFVANVNVIDNYEYWGNNAWINGTVYKGKYDLANITIESSGDVISTVPGYFEYPIVVNSEGQYEFYVKATDIYGYSSISGPYYIQFNSHPVQINLLLEEFPYPTPPDLPKIDVNILIKDAIFNIPLSNTFFDLFVERNNTIITTYRNLLTGEDGTYQLYYDVERDKYLDIEYKFTVEVHQMMNYQYASASSYIMPTLAPCYIKIINYTISNNAFAGDHFSLQIEYYSLANFANAWLLLNNSIISDLNLYEGNNTINIINDRAGLCNYQIRVINDHGYSNISKPLYLYFKPNPIICEVKHIINYLNKYLFINISILDKRTNQTLPNIPIDITIYDNNLIFWKTTLPSTLPYTPIYIQFDLSSHNFSIFVNINNTSLYKGQSIKILNIAFKYKPYPYSETILMVVLSGVGISVFFIQNKKNNIHIKKED
ncbi:MAG: hypothetical protein ACTSQO_06755 [Candidatus Helarchaeota archaeon]